MRLIVRFGAGDADEGASQGLNEICILRSIAGDLAEAIYAELSAFLVEAFCLSFRNLDIR